MLSSLNFEITKDQYLELPFKKANVRFHSWWNLHYFGNPNRNPRIIATRLKNLPLISLRSKEYYHFLSTSCPSDTFINNLSKHKQVDDVKNKQEPKQEMYLKPFNDEMEKKDFEISKKIDEFDHWLNYPTSVKEKPMNLTVNEYIHNKITQLNSTRCVKFNNSNILKGTDNNSNSIILKFDKAEHVPKDSNLQEDKTSREEPFRALNLVEFGKEFSSLERFERFLLNSPKGKMASDTFPRDAPDAKKTDQCWVNIDKENYPCYTFEVNTASEFVEPICEKSDHTNANKSSVSFADGKFTVRIFGSKKGNLQCQPLAEITSLFVQSNLSPYDFEVNTYQSRPLLVPESIHSDDVSLQTSSFCDKNTLEKKVKGTTANLRQHKSRSDAIKRKFKHAFAEFFTSREKKIAKTKSKQKLKNGDINLSNEKTSTNKISLAVARASVRHLEITALSESSEGASRLLPKFGITQIKETNGF